jgi:uncharacterized membrane protein YgaE (UPF0421/DUF939 family)
MNLRASLRVAIQYALVCLIAYEAGRRATAVFHAPSSAFGAVWAAFSGLTVMASEFADMTRSSWKRLAATLIATVISALFSMAVPFSAVELGAAVAATVIICRAIGLADFVALATAAAVMSLVIGHANPELPPWTNGALRFTEGAIGIASAAFIAFLFQDRRAAAPRDGAAP